MNRNEEIDKLLRKSLESYKPSPDAIQRQRFLEAAAASPVASSNKTRYVLLGLTALLLMISSAGWFFLADTTAETELNPQLTNTASEIALATQTDKLPEQTSLMVKAETLPINDQKSSSFSETENKSETQLAIISETAITEKATPPVEQAVPESTNRLQTVEDNQTTQSFSENLPDNITTEAPPALEQEAPSTDETANESPQSEVKKRQKQRGPGTNQLSLYYRPEMIFNIIENEKLIHTFGVEFNHRLFDQKFLIGTGIGLSISKGYYEYAIAYNEFLGTYQKLDSISFQFNQESFEMVHTIHTTELQVFDEETKLDYAKVYRQFVYLEIPLLLGYDFIRKPRYTLGFRFAPILSVLLTNKAENLIYDGGLNQIIQINKITPERVQTNWQLSTGINYTRKAGNHLSFEIEPQFGYYFNSVYQKSDHTDLPYSIGLRLAIGFR